MGITERDNLVVNKVNAYQHTLGKRVALRFYNWDNLSSVGKSYVAENLLHLAQLVDAEAKHEAY